MIKQLICNEIKEYIKTKPNCVLLDVRTKDEWEQLGKPDGEKIGIKTFFLSIQSDTGEINDKFVEEFKKLKINQNNEILTMCGSGIRSQFAAELLVKENFSCVNISDGFEGNAEDCGWEKSNLPCK